MFIEELGKVVSRENIDDLNSTWLSNFRHLFPQLQDPHTLLSLCLNHTLLSFIDDLSSLSICNFINEWNKWCFSFWFLVLATKSISLVSCLTVDNCWWRCVELETMLLFSLFPCCRVMTQGLILVLFLLLFKSLGKMNKICYWCLGVLSFCLANIWQSCILFIRLQPLKKVSLMRGFDLS